MDATQAMHRYFPAAVLAGVFVFFACVTAIAADTRDRVEMFGMPMRGAVVFPKERVEAPNVDDRDVVVLKRTFYLSVPATEVNYIDEQCRTCIPKSDESIAMAQTVEAGRRADLARFLVTILICAFSAGIIQHLFPVRTERR